MESSSKLKNILNILGFYILFVGLCGFAPVGMLYVASLFPLAFFAVLLLVCLRLFLKRQKRSSHDSTNNVV